MKFYDKKFMYISVKNMYIKTMFISYAIENCHFYQLYIYFNEF